MLLPSTHPFFGFVRNDKRKIFFLKLLLNERLNPEAAKSIVLIPYVVFLIFFSTRYIECDRKQEA